MSEQLYDLYNIVTSSSTITYSNLALIAPVDGLNTFDGKFVKYSDVGYTQMITGSHNVTIWGDTRKYTTDIMWHVYGTITKQDITDGVAFYAITNSLPYVDETILIPANPKTTIIYFDFITFNSSDTTNYNGYAFNIRAFDEDYNELTTKYYLNLRIGYYCL